MLKKMIEEDNLGNTNCLTLHEVDSLHAENCKIGGRKGALRG